MKTLLSFLCLLAFTGQAATLNVGTIKSYLDKPSGYVPYAAGFSGTAQYLRRTSTITGLTDSSQFTISFWLDLTGGDAGNRNVITMHTNTTSIFTCLRTSTNTIRFFARNSAGTTIMDAVGSGTYTAASPAGWVHFLLAVDLTSTATRHLYTNGVEDASVTWNTYNTAGVIDFSPTSPDFYIAAMSGGGSLLVGSLSELWFNDTYLDDITKFRAGGLPVSLGATGETPLGGVSPALYFSQAGSGASWNNSASASTFTVTGTPSSPSPPP